MEIVCKYCGKEISEKDAKASVNDHGFVYCKECDNVKPKDQ